MWHAIIVQVLLATGLLSPTGLAGAQQATAVFTPEDLLEVVHFSGRVAVSPDGSHLAYVLPDMDDEWNVLTRQPVGYVHVQEVGGSGETTQLTGGTARSSFPSWSPDGSKLAFFIEDERGGQLAVWDSVARDVRRYGRAFPGKASSVPQWASDEKIVYATPVGSEPEPEQPRVEVVRSSDQLIPGDAFFARTDEAGLAAVDLSTREAKELVGPSVWRQFTLAPGGDHLIFVVPSDETLGIVGGEVNETYLLPIDGGLPIKIAEGGQRFRWSSDGSKLVSRGRDGMVAYVVDALREAAEEAEAMIVPDQSSVGAFRVAGGGLVTVDSEPYLDHIRIPMGTPVWSPDGTRFATLVADDSIHDPEVEPGQPGMYSIARPFIDLYVVNTDGDASVNATGGFDDNVSNPVWSPDGESVVFRTVNNQTYGETLYRYTVDGGKLQVVAHGEETYGNLVAGNDDVILTIQSATVAPDLWKIDDGGVRRRLTDLNPQLRSFRFSKPELFHFDNADGERMGALLYMPVAGSDAGSGSSGAVESAAGTADSSTMAPGVITYIYEKLTPGLHRFNARQQMFVGHGYAVLMPNVKIKVGETGTSYVKSVVPAVEAVRRMGVTNGKACLWGGSFGAYGTSFVITQTNIFDCAVSRATPPELFRNWASGRDRDSDNIERGQARMGGSPFEFQERYIEQSAFFHLDKVETPVLIMHGVKDYTILFGEGEMMFYALRRLGKVAEFVIYNEGDHSLSRHSRADTLDVNNRMLSWFEKYLR